VRRARVRWLMRPPASVFKDPSALVAALGVAYAAVYAAATLAFPPPPGVLRVVVADVFLLLPALAAALLAGRAARLSREGERAFWTLLTMAATASAASQALFALHDAWWPQPVLRTAAHVGYYGWIVLLAVSLLVRPERPRTLQQARWASFEWLIAVLVGYFLVLYFAVLPFAADQQPWYVVLMAQEMLPALAAVVLAARAGPTPFRRVYRTLAGGLVVGALGSAYPNWLYTRGQYQVYSPWEAFWVMPLVGVAAAARLAPAAGWLRAPWTLGRSAPRPVIALAVAVPPLIDLLARALTAAPPRLVAQRTELALCTAAVVALVAAARMRGAVPELAVPAADADEARTALGEPNPYLQFTSGVAHELNNPLTAVSGWAELSLHGGGAAEPLQQLLAATRDAAEVVQELQRVTRTVGKES
jgi:signal transduction histidine kinase